MERHKFKHSSSFYTAAVLLAGLLLFVFVAAGAPLYQAFLGDDSRTWIPIVGLDAYPSDEYYAMEIVASIIHAGEIPVTESQAAEILPQWERKRFSTLSTAAAFSFLMDEIRYALLSSLVVTGIAYFLIPVLGFWLLTGNPLSGLFPAILFYIWPNIWSLLSNLDPWLANGWFLRWLAEFTDRAGQVFYFIAELRKPEYVTQTLRFPFPGIAFLQLSLFFFCLIALVPKTTVLRVLLLASAGYWILFSYQPVLVIACFSVMAVFCVCLIHRDFKLSALYMILGLAMLSYLLISGYREGVVADMQSHAVVAHLIGDAAGNVVPSISLSGVWQVLFNRYSISALFCLAIVWRHRTLRYFVLTTLFVCLFVKASALFEILPATYGRRLERRGIDPIWMLTLGVSLWHGWTLSTDKLSSRLTRQSVRIAGVSVASAAIVFPAASFWNFASQKDVADSYSIPNAQWEAIRWLDEAASDTDKIVTADWLDLHYVRIFSGKPTSFATIMNSGRHPDDEIRDYVASLKALGFSSTDVVELFRQSAGAYQSYREDYLRYRRERGAAEHPLSFRDSPEIFDAAWIYSAMMRPKWFPDGLGTAKLESASVVSEAFLDRVLTLYRELPLEQDNPAFNGQVFYLLHNSDIEKTANPAWRACPESFKNAQYRIFACAGRTQ